MIRSPAQYSGSRYWMMPWAVVTSSLKPVASSAKPSMKPAGVAMKSPLPRKDGRVLHQVRSYRPDRRRIGRAAGLRQRVLALPDPDDELLRYLPSRSVEGAESGVSQRKAIALCRRMVAVHCLYGVDKNPLAG